MSRLHPLLLTAAAVTALPCAAFAATPTPTRVGIDQKTQVSFNMTGRTVTVTLRPIDGAENPLARDLYDTDVVLACSGTSPSKKKVLITDASVKWPNGQTAHQFRLKKDVSLKPKWCVLERPQGTDLAVTFKLKVVKTAG
jgi:hypothetical protein